MQLVDLVAVSRDLSATSSRNAKAVLIADLLTRAAQEARASAGSGVGEGPGVDEIELVAGYLSGAPRQRRTGIELTHLTVLPPPATVASVTLDEVDAVLQRAADLSGAGSSTARATLFAGLLARLTADEQRFVTSLLRGGLRQGALESVVLTAVAGAAGAPVAEVRRAVTVSGSLARVASAALREGPQALARFTLTLGQGVSPMLAGSARTVPEALARTGPAGWSGSSTASGPRSTRRRAGHGADPVAGRHHRPRARGGRGGGRFRADVSHPGRRADRAA